MFRENIMKRAFSVSISEENIALLQTRENEERRNMKLWKASNTNEILKMKCSENKYFLLKCNDWKSKKLQTWKLRKWWNMKG